MHIVELKEFGLANLKQLLAQIPFFADLAGHAATEYDLLLKSSKIYSLDPGEVLVTKGTKSPLFYVLLKGQLDVFGEEEPGEAALSQLGSGQVIGALGALNNDERTATLASSRDEESSVLAIDYSNFGALDDFSKISMMTKIRLYRSVVNNTRFKLETYKKMSDDPTLAQELSLYPPFSGERDSLAELKSLAEAAQGLACLLDSWNEVADPNIELPAMAGKGGLSGMFNNMREKFRF